MKSYLIASIYLMIKLEFDILNNHHWLWFNDQMLINVSISLEMWMQCGPSHVKCGCNVDPPHLHNLNVDVMWSKNDISPGNYHNHRPNQNFP